MKRCWLVLHASQLAFCLLYSEIHRTTPRDSSFECLPFIDWFARHFGAAFVLAISFWWSPVQPATWLSVLHAICCVFAKRFRRQVFNCYACINSPCVCCRQRALQSLCNAHAAHIGDQHAIETGMISLISMVWGLHNASGNIIAEHLRKDEPPDPDQYKEAQVRQC